MAIPYYRLPAVINKMPDSLILSFGVGAGSNFTENHDPSSRFTPSRDASTLTLQGQVRIFGLHVYRTKTNFSDGYGVSSAVVVFYGNHG